jgi:glucose-1-phosphate adenylyltransferase
VPFGGQYRIIDFVLSNFVNSDLMQIYLLTQFKSHSLHKHLQRCWRVAGITDRFIDTIPAQMWTGSNWYQGTADAIFQNLHLIEARNPDLVCVFGGDHIYKMDIRQMIDFHEEKGGALSVASLPVRVEEAHHFGVIEVDRDGRMIGFQEKPTSNPKTIPGNENYVLASMGNYIFNTGCLLKELKKDAQDNDSDHDFGKDIIPKLFPQAPVYVYNFANNVVRGARESETYWRDVGTLDSYWEANMDLLNQPHAFSLYNQQWPIRAYIPPYPPAHFIHDQCQGLGKIDNSMLGCGSIIKGAVIERSIVGYNVQVDCDTYISESIVMADVEIGANCRIQKAIIDKHVKIAPGTVIGENPALDRKRFTVTEKGTVVIPKGETIGY